MPVSVPFFTGTRTVQVTYEPGPMAPTDAPPPPPPPIPPEPEPEVGAPCTFPNVCYGVPFAAPEVGHAPDQFNAEQLVNGMGQEREQHPDASETKLRRLVTWNLDRNPDHYRRRVEIGQAPPPPPAWKPGDVDPALPDAPDETKPDGPSKGKTGTVVFAAAGLFALWMLARSRRQAAQAAGSTT